MPAGSVWAHSWSKISAVLPWGWKLQQMPVKSGSFGQNHALPSQRPGLQLFFWRADTVISTGGAYHHHPSSLSDVIQSVPLVLITTPGPGAGSFQRAHVVLWWGRGTVHGLNSATQHSGVRQVWWASVCISHRPRFSSAWKCPLRSCFSHPFGNFFTVVLFVFLD